MRTEKAQSTFVSMRVLFLDTKEVGSHLPSFCVGNETISWKKVTAKTVSSEVTPGSWRSAVS